MIDEETRVCLRRVFTARLAEHPPAGLESLRLTRNVLRDELAEELDRLYVETESTLVRERGARGVTVEDARNAFAFIQRGGSRR